MVSKILNGLSVELTLLRLGDEAICMELLKDFLDMLLVEGHVSRVDVDVVWIYYYVNI